MQDPPVGYNGSRLIKRTSPALVLAGDASEQGVAAFVSSPDLLAAISRGATAQQLLRAHQNWLNGELGTDLVVVGTFTPEQIALLHRDQLSSTLREAMALHLILEVLLEQRPDSIRDHYVQYQADSQAMTFAVNSMAGNQAVHPVVLAIWKLCKANRIDLEVVWYPRSTPLQQLADAMSKVVDNSQWLLNGVVFRTVVLPAVAEHGVALNFDLFADDHSTKVPGRFYSRFYCRGTSGVNAFAYRWAWDPATGERRMCFCNGPFDQMAAMVHKLIDERVDVALIYPDWPRHWRYDLESLPASVRKMDVVLTRRSDLCVAGPRCARHPRVRRAPNYNLRMAILIWPRELYV